MENYILETISLTLKSSACKQWLRREVCQLYVIRTSKCTTKSSKASSKMSKMAGRSGARFMIKGGLKERLNSPMMTVIVTWMRTSHLKQDNLIIATPTSIFLVVTWLVLVCTGTTLKSVPTVISMLTKALPINPPNCPMISASHAPTILICLYWSHCWRWTVSMTFQNWVF